MFGDNWRDFVYMTVMTVIFALAIALIGWGVAGLH